MERKLASVQRIEAINPIPNADSIEVAKILGWNVVIKKDQFKVGDNIVYCEVDSILPERHEFDFLKDRNYRIRTIKLRGQVSQGICFSIDILPKSNIDAVWQVGTDVTDIIGVTKYEKPIPIQLKGKIRGNFPRFIPKTDEMRIQAVPDVLERNKGKEFYVTEKLDGTSMTVFYDKETGLHVCSRNLDMAPDHEHKWNESAYWVAAGKFNLEEICKTLGNVALQGELIGPNIQENKYKLKDLQYRIYSVYDIENQKYFAVDDWYDQLNDIGVNDSMKVPIVNHSLFLDHTVEDLVEMSKGNSVLSGVKREGIVIRSVVEDTDFELGRLSFKAINPDFLLKYSE